MNIVRRSFRCQIGRRADMSGLPYGFWFMWGPWEPDSKSPYAPMEFSWKVGLSIYWSKRLLFVDFERGGDFRSWQLVGAP